MTMPSARILSALAGLAIVTGCTSPSPATANAQGTNGARFAASDTGVKSARPARLARRAALSPLADSLAQLLVFVPHDRQWLTAAARGKRMLVDIGRVDGNVKKSPERLAAYREAVGARSPIRVGDRLRLRGPWGTSDVAVSGYDVWNGRIVATVDGAAVVDSLARRIEPLPATAIRVAPEDTVVLPVPDCDKVISPEMAQRSIAVRDSLDLLLRARVPAAAGEVKPASSQVTGCFGTARLALAVGLRSRSLEWSEERIVLLDSIGKVIPLRVSDLRFRAHDLIGALDADGDGVHDLAARGLRERAGGTSILRLDPSAKRLTRLTSGFAWEQ